MNRLLVERLEERQRVARWVLRAALLTLCITVAPTLESRASGRAPVSGRVTGEDGTPIAGAMVSFESAQPVHRLTVFSREDGRYQSPPLPFEANRLRARRIGWKDLVLEPPGISQGQLDLTLVRETDPAEVAAQVMMSGTMPNSDSDANQ